MYVYKDIVEVDTDTLNQVDRGSFLMCRNVADHDEYNILSLFYKAQQ